MKKTIAMFTYLALPFIFMASSIGTASWGILGAKRVPKD